ncbi:MAG TPA: cupredoxin domain-containing protein [Nitrososphaerales archaeon]|nr:cupredoxin domain-containing protein [Nitrososphaerales archaeon]
MRLLRGGAAISAAASVGVALVLVVCIAAIGYFSTVSGSQNGSLTSEVQTLQSQVSQLERNNTLLSSKVSSLPAVDQVPVTRNIKLEWSNTENSGQDRFFQSVIVVNQGDNVSVNFVANDTDAHTFTIESPYNFQINATVPGTHDFLKNGAVFTTPATNNSPGVKVSGTPGNVSATGSFIAKWSGIFEYYCIYHVTLGMFGYMIVLPNAAYSGSQSTQSSTTSVNGSVVKVDMKGAAANSNAAGFNPATVTVVIGVNSTVEWVNDDIAPHTVTADDGSFSSGNLNPGDTFSFTFTKPGTYMYHCSYHPWMMATVVVKA